MPKGYQFKKAVPVSKGKLKEVNVQAKSSLSMIVRSNEKDKYKPEFTLDKKKLDNGKLVAPFSKDEKIGTVTIKYTGDDKDYGFITDDSATVDLVAAEDVKKANWFVLTLRSIGNFFGKLWD